MYVRKSRIPLAYLSSMQTETTQHICPVWVLSASHHYTLGNLRETCARYVVTECNQRARNVRKAGLLKHGALNISRSMPSCKQCQCLCPLWPAGYPIFFYRADKAMQAYTGALGELRDEMQESTFASWTLEQLQVRSPAAVLDYRAFH